MKALIPKIINGRIVITNKNDYDEVHITVDEMEDILNNAYQQGAREFAEWLPQHFDLRFSNNPDMWIDEYFNHTREKVLSDYKKKNICDYDKDCPTCWSRAFCKEYNETVERNRE